MGRSRVLILVGAAVLSVARADAQGVLEAPGVLVGLSVEVDGQPSSLYAATDGSGRYYLEAHAGSRYSVSLANRSSERLGVVLTVDGLNAISGARDDGRGRMYVLDPWQSTSVQGWRTSLQEVRQFTFVDERRSYAARTGPANEKMGWIEVAVYRERRPFVRVAPTPAPYAEPRREAPADEQANRDRERGDAKSAAPAQAPGADAAAGAAARESTAKTQSYSGTGWGERTQDPVVLVSFEPESAPCQRTTLRYEYRSALMALGILPPRVVSRDRLWQREHAEGGFAPAPRW
jgi:hypothetical protein